jgi:hypothetical protein
MERVNPAGGVTLVDRAAEEFGRAAFADLELIPHSRSAIFRTTKDNHRQIYRKALRFPIYSSPTCRRGPARARSKG